jgi:hypothetical protein
LYFSYCQSSPIHKLLISTRWIYLKNQTTIDVNETHDWHLLLLIISSIRCIIVELLIYL